MSAAPSPGLAVPPTWYLVQVYSVVTGRLRHSWSAGISATAGNPRPIADLSWVGNSAVGFAVTYSPEVREEIRGVPSFNGSISAEWANPSGTKVIGSWNPAVELPQHGEEVTNYEGVIENGKVKPFPWAGGGLVAATYGLQGCMAAGRTPR